MTLRYLDFDYSEDTEGVGVFEAMASVGPSQLAGVQAEVAQVLDWAFHTHGDDHGPLSEGFMWDHDLQAQVEYTVPEKWLFDEASGLLLTQPGQPGEPRYTVTLSISGQADFCDALRVRFKLD